MSTIKKSTSLFNLIVGLSLTLIITFTLGLFTNVYAQGPVMQAINPENGTHTAPLTTSVSITYNQDIDQTTVNPQTFAVHAMQTGWLTQTYSVNGGTISLTPLNPFKPGELVNVSATTGILNTTGSGPLNPTVWQFNTGVLTGSGVFNDSGQTLGELYTRNTAFGDLDGDGDLDAFIVRGDYPNALPATVWFNNGGIQNGTLGTFSNSGQTLGNTISWAVALGDLDADGDLDAFIGNSTGTNANGNTVWLNDGTGFFTNSGQSLGTLLTSDVALGDVDGDGDLDAFVVNRNNQPDKVWLNNGTANFSDSGQDLDALDGRDVKLGDLDADGDLDAFIGNWSSSQPNKVWLNNGTGIFIDSGQSLGNADSGTVALGDVDNDNDLDVLVGNWEDSPNLWLNDGTGTFTQSPQLQDNLAQSVLLGDMDNDGDLDIFLGSGYQDNSVWLNDGLGTFVDSGQALSTVATAKRSLLGDVDVDGDLDIIVAYSDQPHKIWLNQPLAYADLSLNKTINTPVANPGDTVTYILTINNNGPNIASNAIITDTLPSSITVQSVISSNIIGLSQSNNGQTYTWETAFIAMSQPAIITITALVDANAPFGIYTNTATITNTAVDSDTLNNSSAVGLNVVNNPVLLEALPVPNSHTAPITTPVSIEYSQPISAATVSTQTFAVHAMQTGWLTQTYLVNGGIISLTPPNPFKPGELVQVSATTGTLNITGTEPLASTVWQFRTAVVSSTAWFMDSRQRLGASHSLRVALGDLDGDGDLDAFVANFNQPNKVWLNQGGNQGGKLGLFITNTQSLGTLQSFDVKLGDLDGDGDLDAFVANAGSTGQRGNKIWLNNGSGTFSSNGQNLGDSSSYGVDLGDLDGDGDLDAFVTNHFTQANRVWFNDGYGSFVEGEALGSSSSINVKLGDLDGDGDLDAFVVNFYQANEVWLNNGQGTFYNSGQNLGDPASANSVRIDLGDVDEDGDLDALVGNNYGPSSLWLNNGTGLFSESVYTLPASSGVGLRDLDGDGDLDIFVEQRVWLNEGQGVFSKSRQILRLGGRFDLGDLDNDGDLDVFVARLNDQPNQVWFNANKPESLSPLPNSHTAPLTTTLAVTFSDAISQNTVNNQTVVIHSSFQAPITGTFNTGSNNFSFNPTPTFYPGELIQTTVTSGVLDSNSNWSAPYVWQFSTSVLTGSGVFNDSGQALGGLASSADISLGDLDGDGDLDAVVANDGNENNNIWLNNGNGFFTQGISMNVTFSRGVALGDVDGDTDLDIFWANRNNVPNQVWLNDGSGNFSSNGQSLGTSYSYDVALGDLDGDGDLDAFVVNGVTTLPNKVWLNQGGVQGGTPGQFSDSAQNLGNVSSWGVQLGDVDNDGDLDAFVTNVPTYTNKLWLNDGNGFFSDSGQDLGALKSRDVGLGDLDNDGDLDAFILSDILGNEVWFNDGNGIFTNSGQSLGNLTSASVYLGDVDGDGDLDAFIANGNSSMNEPNKVWLNNGAGIFVDSEQTFGASLSLGLDMGDLDGDGDLDAFVANHQTPNTVWLNQPLAYADLNLNKTVTPATAKPGDTVTYTLTITNNGPNIASNAIITDVFPSNVVIQKVISSNIIAIQQSNTGNTYTWDTAFIAMSQPAIITITAIVNTNVSTSTLTNLATVTNTAVDTNTTNNSSSVNLSISPVSSVSTTFTVNSNNNTNDGLCSTNHCSLIEAVEAANTIIGSATPDQIHFNLPLDQETISLSSPLPTIIDPLIISGTTQSSATCATPLVTLNGSNAGPNAIGLNLTAGNSTIHGLNITNFISHALSIDTNGNNRITCNSITNNGGDGVRVITSIQNLISTNSIYTNTGLGIDLGGDGVTINDYQDEDTGANNLQNAPVLIRSIPTTITQTTADLTQTLEIPALKVQGYLHSFTNTTPTTYTVEFFSSPYCNASNFGQAQTHLDSRQIIIDKDSENHFKGSVYFSEIFSTTIPMGHKITATATDPNGNTSEFSQCSVVTWDNDAWPKAYRLNLNPDSTDSNTENSTFEQVIDQNGQSRWFKFKVQPDSIVEITVSNLPANYELMLFKDIRLAFTEELSSENNSRLLTTNATPQDNLLRLTAESDPEAFFPEAYFPDAFFSAMSLPDSFFPDSFFPDSFFPDSFFSGMSLPDSFFPDSFFPDSFFPDSFFPDSFFPDSFFPDSFFVDAFNNAQIRTIIAVSMLEGKAREKIIMNTWNSTGDFYIRVASQEDNFDVETPFHLEVKQTHQQNQCADVSDEAFPASNLPIEANGLKSLILVNSNSSLPYTTQLSTSLNQLAGQEEVKGKIIDISQDARVMAAINQANEYWMCPQAKNLVAEAIKNIITQYWQVNPLEYIVIVGSDEVIPFFRYPDRALLANESEYMPPVDENTASQASLKLGYVLSDNGYASKVNVTKGLQTTPLPELAVGRLVETPDQIITIVDAYLNHTTAGVISTPTQALVTGYDFVEDTANAVATELEAGLGLSASIDTELIVDANLPPEDPRSWKGDDLKDKLLKNRYDIAFLAGHFSAASLLAADYNTRVLSTDIQTTTVDMTNAIFFTVGCHSGYNTVDEHGIPQITRQPDWPQLFAQKGATLIGGTGYQYGNTEFIAYSEWLYLLFSQELRAGTGPVSIGKALVESKQTYLSNTQLRGIDQKSVLEATLYGLPMLQVDLLYGRGENTALKKTSIITSTTVFTTNPGQSLQLSYADISLNSTATITTLVLSSIDPTNSTNIQPITTTYFYYQNPQRGVTVNALEPVLPLLKQDVSLTQTILKGVGFREGTYQDLENKTPLTAAPATELGSPHSNFNSRIFYPPRPWHINYIDALLKENGATYLMVNPAQYKSNNDNTTTGTWRAYNSFDFRLYYSNNVTGLAPLSAPPTISKVESVTSTNSINFRIRVHGNPAAGIQEVWVTYTAVEGTLAGQWQSLDLKRDPTNSIWWEGTLKLEGALASVKTKDMRYIVQAVNGVGLVSMKTNKGLYYIPNQMPSASINPEAQATNLNLQGMPLSGNYSDIITFSVQLQSQGNPVAEEWLDISLETYKWRFKTDITGTAIATIPLFAAPSLTEIEISFAGNTEYLPSTISTPIEITKKETELVMLALPNPLPLSANKFRLATLQTEDNINLKEKVVFVSITNSNSGQVEQELTVITDYLGRVNLNQLTQAVGTYTITLKFGSQITTNNGININLEDKYYTPASATQQFEIVLNNSLYLPIILKQ